MRRRWLLTGALLLVAQTVAAQSANITATDPNTNQRAQVGDFGAHAIRVALRDSVGNPFGSVTNPLRIDPTGTTTQPVAIVSGSAGNGAAGAIGSAPPANGSYTGVNVGGVHRGWTASNPSGSIFSGQIDWVAVNGHTLVEGATGIPRVAMTDSAGATFALTSGNVPVALSNGSATATVNSVANVAYVTLVGADPCSSVAQSSTTISMTSATTTRVVAPTASKKTYICGLSLVSAIANNVAVVEGTGGTCGTGTAGVIGGTTAANGFNFGANGGIALPGSLVAHAYTAGTNVDLCLITSSAGPLTGVIKWVQQ